VIGFDFPGRRNDATSRDMPDEFEIMIAAQITDPAPMPPVTQDSAKPEIAVLHALRPDAPADVAMGIPPRREPARDLHPGFGPLALPALVAATRVLRGGTGQRG
jgi:hypothetical protein